MIDFKAQIAQLEAKQNNDVATTITLVLRCWQAYKLSEDSSDGRVMLQRANHTVIAAHRRNPAHVELYCLTIFIGIEMGHYDSANEMLDKAMGYKSFLRNNHPLYYGVVCFLYAYLEIHQKRVRSAKKHWRALTDHMKNAEPSSYYPLMVGVLHLVSDEYAEAYAYLTEAYHDGCNSMFLYEGLFRYYKKTPHSPETTAILPVLTYAACRGADIAGIAEKYQGALSAAIASNLSCGEKLYAASRYPDILGDLCAQRISRSDFSRAAYAYYKEAEHRQIYVRGLYNALVEAAYENNAQQVNHYPMVQFLIERKNTKIDRELAIYVYHLLLTNKKLEDLVFEQQNNIMALAEICLEKGFADREVASLYYHYWARCRAMGETNENSEKAEAFLHENLTRFQLEPSRHSRTRYVYITEPEKRNMTVYDTENGLIINATSEDVAYTCLGVGQRTVLDEKLTVTRMIAQANPELYLYFFQKGDRRFHVLTYLTNHYLSLESPPETAISVFEEMLADKSIAKSYRMRILVALGQLHYNAFSFDQALECYGEVDEDALDNHFIPQILNVYIQTREYERAMQLLKRKHAHINHETLLESILILLTKPVAHAQLAETAYNLLTNGHFDAGLLTLVLENYNASYSEWVRLSQSLDAENHDVRLDVRILEMALWMAKWEPEPQKAFVRLYTNREANEANAKLITDFIEYATYEMIANQAKPEYDVLNVLEKWYMEREPENILLAWGLATIYLIQNITTFNSENILKISLDALENEGILFPVFKEHRPTPIPFIEKHQPFIYRGAPGKDCWLYYRIDDAKDLKSVQMQYVRYGMYVACVPVFYNEEITYYFSEEMPSGSITTREETIKNKVTFLHESNDQFFTINNAIINEQLFKYDQVEKIANSLVRDIQPVRSGLL